MRLTKSYIYNIIIANTDREIRNLQNQKLNVQAYQIVNARNKLMFALLDSIKEFKEVLSKQTEYSRNENNEMKYDAYYFVFDEYTRQLLNDIKEQLEI